MKFIATKTISLTPTGLQGSDLLSKWKQHTGIKDAELWVRIDRTTDPSQFHPTIDYYPTDGEQKGPDMDWNFGDPETPPDEGPSPGGNTGGGSSRTRHEEEPEEEPEEEEPSTPPPGLGGARKKRTKERTPPKKPRARKNRPKTGPEAYRRTKVPGEEKEPSGQYGYEKRGGRTRGSPGARPRK